MFGINDNDTNDDPSVSGPADASQAEPIYQAPTSSAPHPDPVVYQATSDTAPAPSNPTTPDAPEPKNPDDLLSIKQEALQSLAPLVHNLDQTPEEKFKTTMMLLQASDNPALVHEAYAAANQITDEKLRAQALLDVVNEINYFTQRPADA